MECRKYLLARYYTRDMFYIHQLIKIFEIYELVTLYSPQNIFLSYHFRYILLKTVYFIFNLSFRKIKKYY